MFPELLVLGTLFLAQALDLNQVVQHELLSNLRRPAKRKKAVRTPDVRTAYFIVTHSGARAVEGAAVTRLLSPY
jgi:hypothetical protein